jgi:EAL domain-containing protein (putative c-di-GMP-specific phosphodiesterase class I)/multidrug resistance efflux pump
MLLEQSRAKRAAISNQPDAIDTGELELWFQPVYHGKTGAVLHNEVLLRWRDEEGNLHLPQDFLPSLSSSKTLQQIDQFVICQAADLLVQYPDQYLSVNLSGEGWNDFSLIKYVQTVLDESEINPNQLSFELTETAIANDFTAAWAFIRELKNLGCSVVLDDFTSQYLTLFQCQQLDVDLVKADGQLIQQLKTDPGSRVLTRAILEGVQSLTKVAAKFVSDAVTLSLIEEVGLQYLQGYHLSPPSPTPDWSNLATLQPELTLPVDTNKPALAWRLLKGAGIISLALAAAAVGTSSIWYRMTHITVDQATINGRIVRLQAPANGNLEAFYAKPGLEVNSGQVLARLNIQGEPEDEQAKLRLVNSEQKERIRTQLENSRLQGEVQIKEAQLTAERQTLAALKNQLQNLNRQNYAVQQVNVQLASEAVSQEQAAVGAAQAQATAARADYERYKMLAAEGAVSRQQMEKAQSDWQSAEAEVKQAQSALRSRVTSLQASKNGIDPDNNDLSSQRPRLEQTIQAQEATVKTLEAQVASIKQHVNQALALYTNRPLVSTTTPAKGDRQIQEVSAPFSGIVYNTEREQGEQVAQAEPLLTVLDCNELWVETVVSAEVANKIDSQKPVRVHFSNSSESVTGEVELIQPIGLSQSDWQQTALRQTQALPSSIPVKLQGQPLALVVVSIPPNPQQAKSRRFCGVGQTTEVTFQKQLNR